jgi:hypothetical protein
MMEIWKPVVGFEGVYEVSDQGRVRSLTRTISDTIGRTYKIEGKVLVGSAGANRYILYVLYNGPGNKSARYAHDLVARAFIGEKPRGAVTRHLDDNPLNNCVGNLAYGTQKENGRDAIANNCMTYGEIHHNAKYSNELIAKLVTARGSMTSVKAEKVFGLSSRYIREIWSGEARSRG